MPDVDIPKYALKSEQKRNLILRLKYGNPDSHFTSLTGGKLLVKGQAVSHKPRTRKVVKLPDYSKVKILTSKQTKEFCLDITSKKPAIHSNNDAPPEGSKLTSEGVMTDVGPRTLQGVNRELHFDVSIPRCDQLDTVEEQFETQTFSELSKERATTFTPRGGATRTRGSRELHVNDMNGLPFFEEDRDGLPQEKSVSRSGSIVASGKSPRNPPSTRRLSKRFQRKDSRAGKSRRSSKDERGNLEELSLFKIRDSPDESAKTVFFDYPGVSLTFVDVQQAIEQIVPDAFHRDKVESIQFENVSVKFGNGKRENRWHIVLKDFKTKAKLLESGIKLQRPKGETNLTN